MHKEIQYFERDGVPRVQEKVYRKQGDEAPAGVMDPIQEGDKKLTPKQYRAALIKRLKLRKKREADLGKRALEAGVLLERKRAEAVNEFVAAGISTEALECLGLIRKGAGDQVVVGSGKSKVKDG